MDRWTCEKWIVPLKCFDMSGVDGWHFWGIEARREKRDGRKRYLISPSWFCSCNIVINVSLGATTQFLFSSLSLFGWVEKYNTRLGLGYYNNWFGLG